MHRVGSKFDWRDGVRNRSIGIRIVNWRDLLNMLKISFRYDNMTSKFAKKSEFYRKSKMMKFVDSR